jgi:hypothetical protein
VTIPEDPTGATDETIYRNGHSDRDFNWHRHEFWHFHDRGHKFGKISARGGGCGRVVERAILARWR